jgi:uncharacterized protein YndB with AHSA1/START domain
MLMRNQRIARAEEAVVSQSECVEREIVLPVEADTAWDVACEPDGLREWLAPEVELDLRPGGEGVFRWEDGSLREAVVEEVEPGERVVFHWRSPADADDPVRGLTTRVEISLEPVEGGTRVLVVESGFDGLTAPVCSAVALTAAWCWDVALQSCAACALALA